MYKLFEVFLSGGINPLTKWHLRVLFIYFFGDGHLASCLCKWINTWAVHQRWQLCDWSSVDELGEQVFASVAVTEASVRVYAFPGLMALGSTDLQLSSVCVSAYSAQMGLIETTRGLLPGAGKTRRGLKKWPGAGLVVHVESSPWPVLQGAVSGCRGRSASPWPRSSYSQVGWSGNADVVASCTKKEEHLRRYAFVIRTPRGGAGSPGHGACEQSCGTEPGRRCSLQRGAQPGQGDTASSRKETIIYASPPMLMLFFSSTPLFAALLSRPLSFHISLQFRFRQSVVKWRNGPQIWMLTEFRTVEEVKHLCILEILVFFVCFLLYLPASCPVFSESSVWFPEFFFFF